jgi:hypothetical protein
MALPTSRDVHIDSALTDLSIAYRQDAPAFTDRIFPRVTVQKQSDKYWVWDKGDMHRRNIKKRAAGSHFERAGLRLTTEQYYSEQYPLEYPIPDEVRRNADPGVDVEETGMNFLVDQFNMEKDYQWSSTFMNASAGWTSGSVAFKWDLTTGVPVADIEGWKSTIQQQLGASMSHRWVGVCGAIVKAKLMANVQVRNSTIYVTQGTSRAIEQSIAAVLGLDDLVVFTRIYNTAAEGKTAVFANMVDDDFLLVAVPTSPARQTPSAGYAFEWDDGNGTFYTEIYRDEPTKSDILREIGYFDLKQTGPALGVFAADVCD